ncbi:hypothetical protein [Mesotoga sp. Brook.08.YT.4.2.5.1]|uniref:hypothetical protein n=1 Tax=Mesotoga sp. Brook.08.YT.4.2.5.1 TaxID=1421001 RepID=UPI0021558056|nr:hypothetical protein [Mesotoga sp. Brook.08.YT.4.2.5.1]
MRPPISVIELTDGIETVSVIGLEKNTGKTVVLNRLLREFRKEGVSVGLTSTGLEGEKIDQIFLNKKPEINVSKGTYFATSEKDFHNRRFSATVLDLRDYRSPLGRTVFARAETAGEVIISGPSILDYLCETVKTLKSYGCDKVLIDGSTSRLSPRSSTNIGRINPCNRCRSVDELRRISKKDTFCGEADLSSRCRKRAPKSPTPPRDRCMDR